MFEDGADGFEARGGVASVEITNGKDFYPTVHEGRQVMMVRSKAVSGDTWRTIGRKFEKPLNLQRTPFVQFGIFARTAPVQDIYVKLTLKNGKESFDCVVYTCTENGDGIENLKAEIKARALGGADTGTEPLITNIRHKKALDSAHESLCAAIERLRQGVDPEICELDIAAALSCLGEITGDSVRDDMIERIFENFCVGK